MVCTYGAIKGGGKLFRSAGSEAAVATEEGLSTTAPATRAMRNSRQWIASAPEGAARPNVPFTYVDDLLARENRLGAHSAAKGIEIQTGLPSLVDLGVLRHEYGHHILSKYSGGLSDWLYNKTNSFTFLEELGVQLYATQHPAKAFVHAIRYVEPWQLGQEVAISGGCIYLVGTSID
jgi:hypothetical protein